MKTKNNMWDNPMQLSIVGAFLRGELKRVILCFSGLMLCMAYLVFVAQLSPVLFLIPVGVLLLTLLAMLTIDRWQFSHSLEHFDMFRQEQMEQEFRQPHPVYRLFTGEVHLLSDCLICRSGGRLFAVPIEEISRMRKIQYSNTYGLTCSLMIKTDTDKTYQIEFVGKHKKELEKVVQWVEQKNSMVKIEGL